MSFQRLSERVEGISRPPESRWKVVPQSRTGGRETPITEFVMLWDKVEVGLHVKNSLDHYRSFTCDRRTDVGTDVGLHLERFASRGKITKN